MSNFDEFVDRDLFDAKVKEHYDEKVNGIKKPWYKTRVDQVINVLKTISNGGKKNSMSYHYSYKYDLFKIGEEEILVNKVKNREDPVIQIVPCEQFYDILCSLHQQCGHGGRDKTLHEVKKKYLISKPIIEIFISLCTECKKKKPSGRRKLALMTSIMPQEFNSQGQVDFIDFQSIPDGQFKWLMNYQDCATKFLYLRPLKSKQASEVAEELLKIFLLQGPPCTLQSDSGHELVARIITEIKILWPACKISPCRPCYYKSQQKSTENQDVENMLRSWLAISNSTKWSLGCHFIQFGKNNSLHRVTLKTPYRAVYGCEPKVGSSSSTSITSQTSTEEVPENPVIPDVVSLEAEADSISEQSTVDEQEIQKCHCKNRCDTRRCSCFTENLKCNSECHSSFSCCNE